MKIQKASAQDKPIKTIKKTVLETKKDIINNKVNSRYIGDFSQEETMAYYDNLNNDMRHYRTNDDICTPMDCVKVMIDYLPEELWERNDLKILEPCAGNGNFGAYCKYKTDINNIWFNELNIKRVKNCKELLNPKNLRHEDFFKLDGVWDTKYDLIMANPPYSGGGNKNQSLSNKFIEKSIDMLKDKGYLCYVTPNNWMTYNNNNTTLRKLLNEGSFLVIDNDVKKYFPNVGSSFTIIIWQKNVYDNKTYVVNNFLKKDIQKDVVIPSDLNFIPLYISQEVLKIIPKLVIDKRNNFDYRCDLHNYTKKDLLSDTKDNVFKYKTIHTMRKIRYAKKKQDIYDKWIIVIPLSTYYIPVIEHHTNTTQSVGYIPFGNKVEAKRYLKKIEKPEYKLIVHLTRYGNFNNIMVLKHLDFDDDISFTKKEAKEISLLTSLIKY